MRFVSNKLPCDQLYDFHTQIKTIHVSKHFGINEREPAELEVSKLYFKYEKTKRSRRSGKGWLSYFFVVFFSRKSLSRGKNTQKREGEREREENFKKRGFEFKVLKKTWRSPPELCESSRRHSHRVTLWAEQLYDSRYMYKVLYTYSTFYLRMEGKLVTVH